MSRDTIVKCDACKKRINGNESVYPFKYTIQDFFTEQHRYITTSGELCRGCGDKIHNFVMYGDKL